MAIIALNDFVRICPNQNRERTGLPEARVGMVSDWVCSNRLLAKLDKLAERSDIDGEAGAGPQRALTDTTLSQSQKSAAF